MTAPDGQGTPLPGLDVRINGPFNDLHPREMEEKLKSFMQWTNLWTFQNLFRKGMFLAQDPQALDTDENVQHLVSELEPLAGQSIVLDPDGARAEVPGPRQDRYYRRAKKMESKKEEMATAVAFVASCHTVRSWGLLCRAGPRQQSIAHSCTMSLLSRFGSKPRSKTNRRRE